MADTEPAKLAILSLLAQNYGDRVGKSFSDMYSKETFPIFLHHSYIVLKDFIGVQKAKEQLDTVLTKYNSYMPYE